MSTKLQLSNGSTVGLDENGYLAQWLAWTEEVARAMAAQDEIELQDAHWSVIGVLRDYYGDYEIAPPMRALVKILNERMNEGNIGSRELYRLFPEGPAKQACRYAGLPKPVSCI